MSFGVVDGESMRSILPTFRNQLLLGVGLFLAHVALTGCPSAQPRSDDTWRTVSAMRSWPPMNWISAGLM